MYYTFQPGRVAHACHRFAKQQGPTVDPVILQKNRQLKGDEALSCATMNLIQEVSKASKESPILKTIEKLGEGSLSIHNPVVIEPLSLS